MSDSNSYLAGVCNIGPAEIRLRRRAGWIGLAACVVLAALLAATRAARAWRLLLFFPATLSAAGFLQAAARFCLGFGFKGVFNFGPKGSTESVAQQQSRALDRGRARALLAQALALGAAAALLAWWL